MCILLISLTIMMAAARGLADSATTQPAPTGSSAEPVVPPAPPAPWPGAVDKLAQALTTGDPATIKAMLDTSCQVKRFTGEDKEDASQMLRRVAGGQVLGAHGYVYPPMVMAADIAADFKTAAAVPDNLKKQMIPDADEAMKRANATAAQWVGASLDAQTGDRVGAIVLWCPRSQVPGMVPGVSSTAEPVFVLVKAQEASKDKFRIRQIVYGTPVASAE
jgi:hypothetical protein